MRGRTACFFCFEDTHTRATGDRLGSRLCWSGKVRRRWFVRDRTRAGPSVARRWYPAGHGQRRRVDDVFRSWAYGCDWQMGLLV
jgi:hypothetical protein